MRRSNSTPYIDEKNGFVYFSGTERSPTGLDVYRVKLDGTAQVFVFNAVVGRDLDVVLIAPKGPGDLVRRQRPGPLLVHRRRRHLGARPPGLTRSAAFSEKQRKPPCGIPPMGICWRYPPGV